MNTLNHLSHAETFVLCCQMYVVATAMGAAVGMACGKSAMSFSTLPWFLLCLAIMAMPVMLMLAVLYGAGFFSSFENFEWLHKTQLLLCMLTLYTLAMCVISFIVLGDLIALYGTQPRPPKGGLPLPLKINGPKGAVVVWCNAYAASSSPSSSLASSLASITAGPAPLPRRSASILAMMAGFSTRYCLAFSRP